jgi:hypothetical protein
MFPEEKTEQRTVKEFRRDVAAVVTVGQRGEMNMAIDEGLPSRIS